MENQPGDPIFALDIGTRSIIGIVGRMEGDLFCVQAVTQLEHPKRAMIDGQIEDIDQVARIAAEVKRQLEEQIGTPLKKVAVAAAGRALKTCRASAALPLKGEYVTAQMAYELEQNAVNEARAGLDTSGESPRYYCVGHSVVQYRIDDYPFTSIYDHRGEKVEADVIATFLPAEVVGSLRRCMEMIDLEVDTLTLEPIAAMRAVLPPDVRLLNLALIDIGAGTADIALTRDGAVSGYTMATVAGDEITEAVIRKFLVDFATAEAIKLAAGGSETITYKDILGHERQCEPEDVRKAVDIAVEMLAKVISGRILEVNEGPPAAIFLVGGGANTPELAQRLAEKIGLDNERVGIAGTNFSGRVLNEDSGLDAPEYATPVGIALVAADQRASGAATVLVNGHRVRLFGEQKCSVMDTLLIAGYRYSDLMGRNGHSLTFTLNGSRKVLRGGAYSVAEVALNGKPASLTSPVENGDVLEVQPATSGEDAAATIADFADGATGFFVTMNGHRVSAGLVAYLNGSPAQPDNAINELDEVEIQVVGTVGALCRAMGYAPDDMELAVNKVPATPDTPLKEGDVVEAISDELPKAAPILAVAGGEAAAPLAPTEKIPVARVESKPEGVLANEGEGIHSDDTTLDSKSAVEAEVNVVTPDVPQLKHKHFPSVLDRREGHVAHAGSVVREQETVNAKDGNMEKADVPVQSAEDEAGGGGGFPTEEKTAKPTAKVDETTAKAPLGAGGEIASVPSAGPVASKPSEARAGSATDRTVTHGSPAVSQPERATPGNGGRVQIELNGKTLVLPPKHNGESHTIIDLLPLVDIDPANPKGKLVLEINHREAGYLDELRTSDSVVIGWAE